LAPPERIEELMETIQKVVLIVHTLIALMIIVLVLLQRGKGADAGAAFGAGASGTVFGARGSASFFSRMTAVFATLFFVSSLTLAYLSAQHVGAVPGSLLDEPVAEEPAPAAVPAEDASPAAEELPSMDDSDAMPVPAEQPAEQPADQPAGDALPELPDEDTTGG
jgi:preprotein translocase subunit SecG